MGKATRALAVCLLVGFTLAFVLVACGRTAPPPPTPAAPVVVSPPLEGKRVLGVAEVTLAGIGTESFSSEVRELGSNELSTQALGFASSFPQLQEVSNGSFDTGTRGADGTRHITVNYNVRNADTDGNPLPDERQNLTFVLLGAPWSTGVTPYNNLRNDFFLAFSPERELELAESIRPTVALQLQNGVVTPVAGKESFQAFSEAEVGAISLANEPGFTVFPFGFVTRNVNSTSSRTLPANPAAGQFDGRVTFSLEVPLAADPDDDLRFLSFVVIAMDDSTTRVTESLDEQGSTNVMTRASALGASVNVLPGSGYAGDAGVDYLCSVRTAGTPVEPIAFLVRDTGSSACQADADLPAPWQNVTLGGGFGSASYDEASESFALSSTSSDVPSEHFVYQTLSENATLTARVQTLTTTSPDGRAGLMLRQSNDADAAYVFVALTQTGIDVESREGGTSSPVHVSGSSAAAPVWLKLERKEDGVYVYESDDGVNWVLVTTLALSLSGNSNIGLAGAVSGTELMSTFTQVTLAQSEASEVRKQEEVLTPEKRGMAIRHYEPREMWRESVAGVAFSADALDANTLIKLSTTDEPATNYPDDPYFTKNYPADKVRYLGPLTTVEIPLDTLNWRGEEEKSLFDISPSFYQGVIGNVAERDIFLEVRIPRPDGQLVFYTFDFGFFGTARFSNKFLQTNLLGSEPETLVISVQAVDLSGVLNAPSPTSPQNKRDGFNLTTQANTPNEGLPKAEVYEGLYHVEVGAGLTASAFTTCETNNEPINVPGFTEVTGPVATPEGKTPLLLVHGWLGMETFTDSLTTAIKTGQYEDEVLQDGKYNPALCYWKDFILNFTNENSISAALDSLRANYELYSYGYESLDPVTFNADYAGNPNSLAKMLGYFDKDVVILAHSMGGLVANTYMQQNRSTHKIKHLITAGTPYMGSPVMLCRETSEDSYFGGGKRCVDTRFNFSIISQYFLGKQTFETYPDLLDSSVLNPVLLRSIAQLKLLKISRYQGAQDLSWQVVGVPVEPDISDCFNEPDADYQVCKKRKIDEVLSTNFTAVSSGNPLLARVNFQPDSSKHTVFYGNGSAVNNEAVSTIGESVLQFAVWNATKLRRNDSVVTTGSACMAERPIERVGNTDDCEESPFPNLILLEGYTHTQVHKKPNLPAITVELLRVAGALLDIDDGTPDGNQRLYIGNTDSAENCELPSDKYKGTGICDNAKADSGLLSYAEFDFGGKSGNNPHYDTAKGRWLREGEDADSNERLGDGDVGSTGYSPHLDMSDFRRWRDAYLEAKGAFGLNGSANHPKRDMNGDRINNCTRGEGKNPCWADFNGDSKVDLSSRMTVAGLTGIEAGRKDQNNRPHLTDLEVFTYTAKYGDSGQPLWRDEHYTFDIIESIFGGLDNLVNSADVEVYPHYWFTNYDGNNGKPNIQCVRSNVVEFDGELENFLHKRGKTDRDVNYERQVYTLPLILSLSEYTFEAYAYTNVDCTGTALFEATKTTRLEYGSDTFWDPVGTVVDIDDGTKDGNQLLVIGTKSAQDDDDHDGVADDMRPNELLLLTGLPFDGEDADHDTFLGDGERRVPVAEGAVGNPGTPHVDMADFRRVRDWLTGVEKVGSALAAVFGDYNHDGTLDFDTPQPVSGVETDSYQATRLDDGSVDYTDDGLPELTDLEVFYNLVKRDALWSDEHYGLTDLKQLQQSGDLEVWPRGCMALSRAARVVSEVVGVEAERTHAGLDNRESGSHIYTLPVAGGPYTVRVTAYDVENKVVAKLEKTVNITASSDELWDPFCADFRFTVNGADLENFAVLDAAPQPKELGEAGAEADACPLASVEVRIEVEAVGLTDVDFVGLWHQQVGEGAEGSTTVTDGVRTSTWVYQESTTEVPAGGYQVSATGSGDGGSERGFTGFTITPLDCAVDIFANGTLLVSQAPVVDTHVRTTTCTGTDDQKADVDIRVEVTNIKDKDGNSLVLGLDVAAQNLSGETTVTDDKWTYSGTAEGLDGADDGQPYDVSATVTYVGGQADKTEVFKVDLEETGPPDDCGDDGGDGGGTGGGGDPTHGTGPGPDSPLQPIKITEYRPKRRPLPGLFAGGWGCWRCLWGGWGGLGGGGGGGLAGVPVAKTYGDPHISTTDGVAYSTMALGEFVYARGSDPDGVVVQARQTRLPNFADWASFNTAAAVRVGGHTYEVRLPASRKFGDDLTLLIDGEPADLPPGSYAIGDGFVEIDDSNQIILHYQEPGVPSTESQKTTRVRIGTMTENQLVRPDPATDVLSLEVTMNTPLLGRYAGFFGTPDGDADNEFVLPSGSFPDTWAGFIEGWRVTQRADSLFTYAPGEGPETYNLVQDATMPSVDDLLGAGGGTDYFAVARDLLQNTCGADLNAVDPTFVRSAAIELAAGRPAQNMVDSGICLDEHVAGAGQPDLALSGLTFEGRLSLAGLPEVDISGATVTIYSPTLGQNVCESASFQEGRYSCGASFFTPSSSSLALTYRITGRGQPVEFTTTVPTPAGGDWGVAERDFAVNVERVLHLTGRVTHPSGAAVADAKLRVSGPAYLQAQADASGNYDVYLPLPDGVSVGVLTLEATGEDLQGYAKLSENFVRPETGVISLARDLVLTPDAPPADDKANDRTVVFTGKVLNTLSGGVGVANVPVSVSAPGSIEDGRCETVSAVSGAYTCSALLTTTEGFSATVSGQGFGTGVATSVTLSAQDLPTAGASVSVERDLNVQPATLRLGGRVLTDEANVDATVSVTVLDGPTTLATLTTAATGAGDYDGHASLPDAAPAQLTLRYRATVVTPVGPVVLEQTVPVTNPGIGNVLEVGQDLVFAARQLLLTGRVVNTLVPRLAVPGAAVSVTNVATSEVICTTVSDGSGFYRCPYEVRASEPFRVRFEVAGKGSLSVEHDVDPSAAGLDGLYPVVHNLPVTPATLSLSGQVRDNTGVPIEGASVKVTGGGETLAAETDAAGRYALFFTPTTTHTSGTLTLDTEYESPFGTATATTTASFTLAAGQLEELSTDVALDVLVGVEYDRVAIQGRLTNATVAAAQAAEGVEVLVEGSGANAGLGKLCLARTKAQGLFECGSQYGIAVPRLGDIELRYTALVDGRPIAAPVTEHYAVTPSIKLVNRLYPDVSVNPAVLKLSGRVRDLADQPVPQATLRALAPVARQVTTDAQGVYDLFVPLPLDATSGTLSYDLSQSGVATGDLSTSYTVPAGSYRELDLGVTTLEFNLYGRTLVFSGTALPARASDLRLPATQVAISSPGEGLLCDTALDLTTGGYACTVFTTNPNDLDLVYRFSGSWGAAELSGVAAGGLFGTQADVSRNFDVPVTVLSVSGTVADEAGTPLPGAELSVSGDLSAAATADAAGGFSFTSIVPDTLETADLTLTAAIGEPSLEQAEALELPLVAGELNSLTHDIVFTQRRITLAGRLGNAHAPTMALPGADLVLSLDGSEVCRATTGSEGAYACPPLQLANAGPFTLDYTVTAPWGEDTASVELPANNLPGAGESADVALDLGARPTTLRFTGRVADDLNNPLVGATVSVAGGPTASLTTTSDGVYDVYFLVDDPSIPVYLGVTSRYGSADFSTSQLLGVPVVANELTTKTHDIVFAVRAVQLSGTVVSTHQAGIILGNLGVEVRHGGEVVCWAMTTAAGELVCPELRLSTTAPVDLEYSVTTRWGVHTSSLTLPVEALPLVGERGSTPLTFSVPLTTVVVRGVVSDEFDNPLNDAAVTLDTGAGDSLSTVTNEAGAYELRFVYGNKVVTPVIRVSAEENFSIQTAELTPTLVPGSLTELDQNFVIKPTQQFSLTWGYQPRDLDAYLWLPVETPYQVYSYSVGSKNDFPFATLDVEDRSSFGPEIITVHERQRQGTYYYAVYNDSNEMPFTSSNASLEIHNEGEAVMTIAAPTEGSGRWWYVLMMDGATGEITVVNEYLDRFHPYDPYDSGAVGEPLRVVRVTGTVSSTGVRSGPLSNYYIEVRTTNGMTVCGTVTNEQGGYTCSWATRQVEAFDVTLDVAGDIGGLFSEATIPTSEGIAVAAKDFVFETSRVSVSGVVTDAAGTPLDNARVNLYSDFSYIWALTDSAGRYELDFILATPSTPLELTMMATNGNVKSSEKTSTVTLIPGEVTSIVEDFVADQDDIRED